jgi:hypothetical protein
MFAAEFYEEKPINRPLSVFLKEPVSPEIRVDTGAHLQVSGWRRNRERV